MNFSEPPGKQCNKSEPSGKRGCRSSPRERKQTKQEAPRSIMGRRSTSINLLAFSVSILSWKSNSRKLAHWAKCLHLGVGQMVSECTSSLNGLTLYRLDQNKVRSIHPVFQKIDTWLQIAVTCPSLNSLPEKHSQKSNKMVSFSLQWQSVL